MCVSNVAGNELFFGFAAEQIAICNENAELWLVNWLQTLQNYQFAITRDNCGHIFRSVKAGDFSKHCSRSYKFVRLGVKGLRNGQQCFIGIIIILKLL